MKRILFNTGFAIILLAMTAYFVNAQSEESQESQIKVMSETYTITHEKDNTTYTVALMWNEVSFFVAYPEFINDPVFKHRGNRTYDYNYVLQLFDSEDNLLQSYPFDEFISSRGLDFQDVNVDGYTDFVIYTGGTRNETHDLYIWDIPSKNFVKVIYEGFEMLSFFEVNDGYIHNYIRGGYYEPGISDMLFWNGNILTTVRPDTLPNDKEALSITGEVIKEEPLSIEIRQNNAGTSPLPLWAWLAIIGGTVAAAGGVVVFMVKRKK